MSPEDDKPGRQQRRHKRVAAREVTAEIVARDTSTSHTVLNISTGGLLIDGARPASRGALLEITLRMTGSKPVEATGRVVHELAQGIGIAFEPFSSAVAESLEKLIEAVETKNNLPPPLRPKGQKDEAAAPHPPLDPFASGPDPRPPKTGSPDEKVDYLRALVKRRDETLARARAMFSALTAEAEGLRASTERLTSRLEVTTGQLELGEAALAAARRSAEKHAAQVEAERATARELLEQEQRGTLEAIGTVAGLEMKLRHLESEAANARLEADAATAEKVAMAADAAGVRKLREELVAANRKAMETQAQLTRERTSRIAADDMIRGAREAQVKAEGEAKQLSLEVAKLKQKLIVAENALERSAARRVAEHRPAPATKR